MEPRGSSNDPCPEPNKPNSSYWHLFIYIFIPILSPHLRLPRVLFLVGLHVKILKVLLPCSILAACRGQLNLLITLTILVNGTNYEIPHCVKINTSQNTSIEIKPHRKLLDNRERKYGEQNERKRNFKCDLIFYVIFQWDDDLSMDKRKWTARL